MLILADRLITGDGTTVLEDAGVLMENGKITDMGDASALMQRHPNVPMEYYEGCTLMPGLIEMHAHIGYWWSKPDAGSYNDFLIAYYAEDYARKAFSKGVTTIRDVSSPAHLCVTMNRAAEKGYLELPRILTTDVGIIMTGGHSASLVGGAIEADSPWSVRAAVREVIKRGAHWVKLMASHRSNFPEFTQEELDAAVDECHRVGKKVAVHAGTQPSIQMCIDAGFDTIEHGTHMTVAQARQMAEKGLAWVPTITAYTISYEHICALMSKPGNGNEVEVSFVEHYTYFRDAAEAYRNNFKALSETGVKIVTGTDVVFNDAPVTPVATEMKYMAQYGLAPLSVIHAATLAGAQVLGLDGEIGEVVIGKAADLVLVRGNPLEDMAAMDSIDEVYMAGKSVYKA